MNKLVLVVCGLVLGVSLLNTYLLLQTGARLHSAEEKIEPVAKKLHELQAMLEKLPKPPESGFPPKLPPGKESALDTAPKKLPDLPPLPPKN